MSIISLILAIIASALVLFFVVMVFMTAKGRIEPVQGVVAGSLTLLVIWSIYKVWQ